MAAKNNFRIVNLSVTVNFLRYLIRTELWIFSVCFPRWTQHIHTVVMYLFLILLTMMPNFCLCWQSYRDLRQRVFRFYKNKWMSTEERAALVYLLRWEGCGISFYHICWQQKMYRKENNGKQIISEPLETVHLLWLRERIEKFES